MARARMGAARASWRTPRSAPAPGGVVPTASNRPDRSVHRRGGRRRSRAPRRAARPRRRARRRRVARRRGPAREGRSRVRRSAVRVAGGVRPRGAPRRPGRRARRPHDGVRRPLGGERRRRLPRHARAAARGAGARCSRPPARSGCTSTGARRTSCGCSSTRSWGATRSSTRSSGGARPTSAARRRATSSAARSTRSSSTDASEAKLVPPTRLEPIEPAAVRWDDEGRPFTTAPRGDYTDASIARLEAEGRVHRTASGRVYMKYFLVKNADGTHCRERRVDALWTDVPPLRHARAGRADGLSDAEAARAARPHHRLRVPGGGPRRRRLRRERDDRRERARARPALRRRRRVAARDRRPRGRACCGPGRRSSVESCGPPRASVGGKEPAGRKMQRSGARPRCAEPIRVELVAPREPLAWAIDAAHDRARPFRTAWHSERAPGARGRARRARGGASIGAPGPARGARLARRRRRRHAWRSRDPARSRPRARGVRGRRGGHRRAPARHARGAAPPPGAPARRDVARLPRGRALALRARASARRS